MFCFCFCFVLFCFAFISKSKQHKATRNSNTTTTKRRNNKDENKKLKARKKLKTWTKNKKPINTKTRKSKINLTFKAKLSLFCVALSLALSWFLLYFVAFCCFRVSSLRFSRLSRFALASFLRFLPAFGEQISANFCLSFCNHQNSSALKLATSSDATLSSFLVLRNSADLHSSI